MKIQFCVFDLDGTLLDTIEDLTASANYALQLQGLPFQTTEDFMRLVGNGVHELIKGMIPPDQYCVEIHRQIHKDYSAYYQAHCFDKTTCYPKIDEMLTKLTEMGVRLAVLSNKPHAFTKEMTDRLLGKHPFLTVMGLGEEFPRKPDPESLLAIMQRSGFSVFETLFIGDSDVDMLTARNAGVKPIGVTWGFRGREELKEAGAAALIDQPLELIEVIKNIM